MQPRGAPDTAGTRSGAPGTPVTDPPVATLGTLPPVGTYRHPTGPADVVGQVTVNVTGTAGLPTLTVYGDGRVVSNTRDGWRTGVVSEVEIQELLAGVDAVGLLDAPLSLRGVRPRTRPDFEVRLRVDGEELTHALDLAAIERPPALWIHLHRIGTQNPFGLTEPFVPEAWVSCADGRCTAVDARRTADDRPVLPHEDVAAVASTRPVEPPDT